MAICGLIHVTVRIAASGAQVGVFPLPSSATVADLCLATSKAAGVADAPIALRLFLGPQILTPEQSLAEAGLGNGSVVDATRLKTVQIFRMAKWPVMGIGGWDRGSEKLESVEVVLDSAGAMASMAMQGAGTESSVSSTCLMRVKPDSIHLLSSAEEPSEVFDADEEVATKPIEYYPAAFHISSAGLASVNGRYVRDGDWNGKPRWVHEQGSMWLRLGSDEKWCIVNNSNGCPGAGGTKEFFYACSSLDPLSTKWLADTHGLQPAPVVEATGPLEAFEQERPVPAHREVPSLFQMALTHGHSLTIDPDANTRLLRTIAQNGSALVAAPVLPAGHRPVVLHLHHFSDQTFFGATDGLVNDESFRGLDDECISCVHRDVTAEVWQYVGK